MSIFAVLFVSRPQPAINQQPRTLACFESTHLDESYGTSNMKIHRLSLRNCPDEVERVLYFFEKEEANTTALKRINAYRGALGLEPVLGEKKLNLAINDTNTFLSNSAPGSQLMIIKLTSVKVVGRPPFGSGEGTSLRKKKPAFVDPFA